MDEKIAEQILDELIPSFEALETQSAALLLFLKEQGIATDQKLVPFLEQAARTSDVRWRGVRVRMNALLSSAMKAPETVSEKQPVSMSEDKGGGSDSGAKDASTDEQKSSEKKSAAENKARDSKKESDNQPETRPDSQPAAAANAATNKEDRNGPDKVNTKTSAS